MSEKKISLTKPSGTIDFLPEDMYKRLWLSRRLEEIFSRFGFEPIDSPIYEFFDLFEFRSGEKIINDIFTFTDPPIHRVENPRLYALRPEFTAPIVRFYITSTLLHKPKPVKVFYIGPCFRYDEPAPGRYRQFTQAGVEMFGADTIEADAEILTMAMSVIEELGISNSMLRINDLNFLRTFLKLQNIPMDTQNKVFGIIDRTTSALRKLEIGALEDTNQELLVDDYYGAMSELGIDRDVIELLEHFLFLVGDPEQILSKLKELFTPYPQMQEVLETTKLNSIGHYLRAAGIENFVVDCGIARGLDYYTDMVFEIDVPALGKQKQICGGGRYNRLVADYGGEDTPAVGFAFGFDRILIALEKENKIPEVPPRSDVFIGTKSESRLFGFEIAQRLRKEGFRVEVDVMNRSFKSCAQFVNKMKIPFMIFLGPRELESGKFTLKNFITKEQFKDITFEEVMDAIRSYKEKNADKGQ